MISKLGEVMVYVRDQDEAIRFWRDDMEFVILQDYRDGEMRWVQIAPTADAETTVILHDRAFVEKNSPDINFGTPSLLFFTPDLDALYEKLQAKGVTLGEKVQMGESKFFNFADREDNYFAIMETD